MHTVGPGVRLETLINMKNEKHKYRTWYMARKSERPEHKKYTLKEMDCGEKTEKCGK